MQANRTRPILPTMHSAPPVFICVHLMSDVTNTRSALQRSRQQALNAEKLAAVGKLAASVAHEIRNPLVAVKLWLTTIQKKRHTDTELCRDYGYAVG